MRKFLSNFLLTIFITVFAFPVSTFAQFSWTPPAGPPVGNNTPSPINVGPIEQWRRGLLKIGDQEPTSSSGTILSTTGGVVFDYVSGGFASTGANSFASFLPNTLFAGNSLFQVGSESGTGGSPQIFLNGRLRYIPRNANGSPMANQQPQAGYVLRAIDSTGLVGWGPGSGVPNGSSNGDTLIWDETCNCWVVGPSTSNLPSGNQGQTLWRDAGQWKATNLLRHVIIPDSNGNPTPDSTTILSTPSFSIASNRVFMPLGSTAAEGRVLTTDNTGLVSWVSPSDLGFESESSGGCATPALPGQTCWYDGETNSWQATDQIFHDTFTPLNFTRTTLNNQFTDIKGTEGVYIGSIESGTTQISSPQTKIISSEEITVGIENSGLLKVNSPSVLFGNTLNNQSVLFNSPSVIFKGPVSNPETLDAGEGRIPFSLDNDGTFKWNRNLTYQTGLLGSIGLGQLRLRNPTNITGASTGIATFVNEGLTSLQDDVMVDGNLRVTSTGDLFLDATDQPVLADMNNLASLCVNLQTKKVMRCQGRSGAVGTPTVLPTPATVTETFTTNGGSLTFPISGQATVKYCAGGGGGGGGGIGVESEPSQRGQGGGGGQGGQKGECHTENLQVTANSVLTWQIGSGGNGGLGAEKKFEGPNTFLVASSDGEPGNITRIYLNGNQIGPMADGGDGGLRGLNAENGWQASGQGGGSGASIPSYRAGDNGFASTAPGGTGSYGGKGGTGEHAGSGVVWAPNFSHSGNGGTGGQFPNSGNPGANSLNDRYGKRGGDGDSSYGGGGGGGGYGLRTNILVGGSTFYYFKGGAGGKGGDGYVQVTYLDYVPTPEPINEYVFDASSGGTIPASVFAAIPSSSITVEVWGGGGGGGGVLTAGPNSSNFGGGGGAGAYAIRTNIPKPTGNVSVTIGAGGAAGVSSGNISSVTNGGNGGTTTFGTFVGAAGGNGGQRATASGNLASGSGPGGAAQSSVTGADTSIPGAAGANGSAGSSGGLGGSGHEGQGGGGNGAKTTNGTSVSTVSGAGQSGYIRITW